MAVFASPPTVTGRWSTDGSTWRNFNDAQAPHLGFSGFGALGEDGQQLQLKVEVGFSSSPGQKKVEVTIADSLEWIDNGASNIPEPIFASVSGPFDRTVWQENVSTQHTFNDGRYVYTFKPDTVSATLNFRVANNTADDYSYQDNPIIVDVSEDSASSQLVLPRINYMTLGYQLAPQSYSRTRTVPLDTDVGMVDSIATVYDHLYTGSDFRRKRLFENMKITLEAPEGAEVQGVYDDNLEIREHMTNGGWTYTNVGTTNYITTWEFTLDKRRASYFGLSPIWRFPSSSFNLGGTATITYKQVEWNYYGGSKYTRVYSNAAGDGVGTRTDRYTFSNTENVLPLAGTYVKANFISPDHPGAHGDLGSYGIANEGGADSTPKWVELEFDTTKVGVTALHLIGEPGTRNIEIQYRKEGEAGWPNTTTLSKTFPDSPQTLSRSLLYGTELGLAKAEYIAALRYKVEHTPGGGGPAYGVKAGHAISSSTNVFYGIAKPGCSSPISTTVNVRDVADANDVQTTTVNTSTSTPNVMSAIVPTLLGDRVVEAGEDIVFSATIKNYNHEQTYLSKAPIIYIRDETGVGISDVSLVSSRGVNLFTAYPDKVIWDHHHTELNGTKVYKIDTSGLNNTSLSYEAQYAAATGYHTYERESRSLQLSWKVSTPSNYNDAIKRHFNHDILWVTDTYSDVMNGAGRRGDPHEVHSTSQFNQLVVGITEGTAYYQVQNRANLDMVTEAKSTQDGSVWKTWNGSTDDLIPTSSTNNYQVRTSVGSDSGQPSSNQSYVYIPIPKKNQEWGVLNEGYSDIPYDTTTYKSTFGFDTFLAGPVSNPDSSRYTITYGTIPTGSFNASTGFGDVGDALKAHSSWNNNYDNTTNMVRIRVSGVSANMPHSFTMELSSNVSTNTENSVNIYRPLYWQDLTNAQADVFTTWAQGDPIAFRLLSIGSLQGQVFFDGNTNSVWDSGEAIPSGTHNFSGWTLGVYEPQGTTPVAEHNLTNDGGYAISGLSRAIAYNLRLTSPQGEPYYVGPSNRTYSTTQQTVGTYNFFALNTGSNTQATAEGVYAVDIPGQQGAEEQGNGIYNIGLTGSTTWTIYTHEDLSSFTNSKDSPSTTYAGNTMNIVTGGPHDTVGNLTVTPQTNYQFVGWMAYNGSASDFATLNNTQKLALSVPSITPSASDLFPTPTDTTTLNYEDRMLYGVHRALTTITATKQWDDNGSGASHPTSVSVQLRQNGTNYGNPVTLNNTNSWTTTWQDLPLNDNTGNPYTYTVTEPTVPPGYTLSTTGTGTTSDPFILTNTRNVISISATKQWDDNGSGASHPTSVSVQLTQNGTNYGNPVTLNNANSWKNTWQNLPEKDLSGSSYTYAVTEPTVPPGYTLGGVTGSGTTGDPFILTNTRSITSISATKQWDDNGSGAPHPTSVSVQLTQNGTNYGNPVTLNNTNSWKNTWQNLPEKDHSGNSYTYAVTEPTVPPGYTLSTTGTGTTSDPFILTNTRSITSISATKQWNDNGSGAPHPTSVSVQLRQNGTNYGNPVTLNSTNSWTTTWQNLPEKDLSGSSYTYAVTEPTVPPGYTLSTTGTGTTSDPFILTNTRSITSISATKQWDDNGSGAPHPTSVSVQLTQNGTNYGSAVTLNSTNSWKNTWQNLPEKDLSGSSYTYAVTEPTVPPGYTLSTTGTGTTSDPFILTNTRQAVTSISATKQWDDNGSGASHPTSVSVQLTQNGTNYGNPVTLNNTNSWTTTWQDLPLNDNTGNPYTYTVTEPTVPPGYTLSTTGTGTTSDPFILTNTRDITSVWVTKKWINPLDETTPSEVKLILLRGIEGSGAPVSYRTHILTGTAGTDWYYTFTNLPEKDLLGNSYIYTIEEEVPTKYTLKITGTGKATDPFILTNSRTMPDPVEVTINGKVILQGKELEADQFTVVLTLPDRLTTLSTKNKADGSFTFPTQTHPLPGNYTYTIHQVQGSAEGITYSGTQYSANLKVTLDSEGNKLNYKLTSTKDGKLMEDGEIFVFINSYSEPAFTPTLTVLPKTGK